MKKYISFLIIFICAILAPLGVSAQVGIGVPSVEVPGPLLTFAGTTASMVTSINTAIGIPGVTQGAVAAVDSAVETLCTGIARAEDVAMTADNFSNFSLIGGSPAEAAQLTAKINALVLVKNCREKQLESLKKRPAPNLIASQEFTRKQDSLATEINSLSVRIESLRARHSQTAKDVLKAVALKITLNLSQSLTTKMVNSLVSKYRINQPLQYAEAVASQVYAVDYINKNYQGQQQDQYILRSLLQNGTSQGGVLPMVRMEADKSLGFIPEELEFSDPNYYMKLSKAGTAEVNPFYRQMIYEDMALTAKSETQAQAKQEMAAGNGFMSIRNCQGAVGQQKTIDQQNNQLSYQANFDQRVFAKLVSQYQLNPNPETKQAMEEAAAAAGKSKEALSALPEQAGTPFVTMCEGISNPGSFVAGSIGGYLNKYFNEAGNIKSENIPFWGSFLSSVATNFVSNIIQSGKPNLQILTSAGYQAANISANDLVRLAGQGSQVSQLKSGDKELNFDYSVSGGKLSLKWDVRDIQGATNAVVSGPGVLTSSPLPVQGSMEFNISQPGTYQIQATNAAREVLAEKTLSVEVTANNSASGGAYVCGGNYTSLDACVQETNDSGYCQTLCSNSSVRGAVAVRLSEPLRANPASLRSSK